MGRLIGPLQFDNAANGMQDGKQKDIERMAGITWAENFREQLIV